MEKLSKIHRYLGYMNAIAYKCEVMLLFKGIAVI